MVDLAKISFDTRLNYMKRSEFVGSQELTLPSAFGAVTHTVGHNLGYVPFFIVGAHLNESNIIWSNNRVHEYTKSSNQGITVDSVQLSYWCTETTLTIRLQNDPGITGTRTVYWVIYLDYGEI